MEKERELGREQAHERERELEREQERDLEQEHELEQSKMNGGMLNYGYTHIETLAEEIQRQSRGPLHRAFARHLLKVSKAAHYLEWVLSGDYSPGSEDEAIRACMDWKKEARAVIREDIEKLKKEIQQLEEESE